MKARTQASGKAFSEASVEVSVEVTFVEALMEASVEETVVEAFMEASVDVASGEGSVEVNSLEVFTKTSVEVTSTKIFRGSVHERFHGFRERFHSTKAFMEASTKLSRRGSLKDSMEASTTFHQKCRECTWPCPYLESAAKKNYC